MIPLDTVVNTEFKSGPDPVTHFNGFNTALVLGAAAPGIQLPVRPRRARSRWPKEVLIPRGYGSNGAEYHFRNIRSAVNPAMPLRWVADGLLGACRPI